MNVAKNKHKKKQDKKSRIIKRQVDEIEFLKNKVSSLEIDCNEKDEIINSIDSLRDELVDVIDDLKTKSEEYDKLIAELMEMRKVFNQEVFNNRWNIIKFLIK